MPATHRNRLVTAISNTPSTTGALTIAAAASGYRTFGASDNGLSFDVSIVDGTSWEIRTGCVYTHSGTSLSRGTLEDSSTGSAISLTSAAVVTVSAIASLANNLEMVAQMFGKSTISVTGAVTATVGNMHLCTGTTADYTVTLPAASGNAGKLIGFQMGTASTLTKFVTLDGNASETIDGALTRVMWGNEVAILLCDGTGWTKIAGKTVAMACRLSRLTDQTGVVGATVFAVAMTNLDFGASALFDSGNGAVVIKRPGQYVIGSSAYIQKLTGTMTFAYIWVSINGTQLTFYQQSSAVVAAAAGAFATSVSLAAGDLVRTIVYQDGTTAQILGAGGASLFVSEVPSW